VANEYTAIIEEGENGWYVASCPEVPGANGQGRTIEDVKEDLAAAIELMLEVMRDRAAREHPGGLREKVLAG
jgi:predicted RNase H-like HicB family nuclease